MQEPDFVEAIRDAGAEGAQKLLESSANLPDWDVVVMLVVASAVLSFGITHVLKGWIELALPDIDKPTALHGSIGVRHERKQQRRQLLRRNLIRLVCILAGTAVGVGGALAVGTAVIWGVAYGGGGSAMTTIGVAVRDGIKARTTKSLGGNEDTP